MNDIEKINALLGLRTETPGEAALDANDDFMNDEYPDKPVNIATETLQQPRLAVMR